MNRRVMWCVLMLGVLFLASGCAEKKVEGEVVKSTYDLNSRLLSIGVTLGGIGYGVLRFREKNAIQGVIGVGVAIASAVFFVPAMFGNYATVTENDLVVSSVGPMGKVTKLHFDDVKSASITMTTTTGRRGRKNKNYYLECSLKSGPGETISMGDLVEPLAEEIFTHLAQRGVQIVNLTGE